jgi:hypothetical protein
MCEPTRTSAGGIEVEEKSFELAFLMLRELGVMLA